LKNPVFCKLSNRFSCLIWRQTVKVGLYSTKINWKIFLNYFEKYASDALCQRTGYILDQMQLKTNYMIPVYAINYFKERIKNNACLISGKGGKHIKSWKLMDNDRNFLKWYYYG